jgi:hypothetical protein
MSTLNDKMNEDIQRIINRLEHIKQEQNRFEKIRLVKKISDLTEDYESFWGEKLADLTG